MNKDRRLKALAGYKEIFDNYLRRQMTAEEQQIYDDCAEGKISFTAEQPSFAVKTTVKAYPTPINEEASLIERLKP